MEPRREAELEELCSRLASLSASQIERLPSLLQRLVPAHQTAALAQAFELGTKRDLFALLRPATHSAVVRCVLQRLDLASLARLASVSDAALDWAHSQDRLEDVAARRLCVAEGDAAALPRHPSLVRTLRRLQDGTEDLHRLISRHFVAGRQLLRPSNAESWEPACLLNVIQSGADLPEYADNDPRRVWLANIDLDPNEEGAERRAPLCAFYETPSVFAAVHLLAFRHDGLEPVWLRIQQETSIAQVRQVRDHAGQVVAAVFFRPAGTDEICLATAAVDSTVKLYGQDSGLLHTIHTSKRPSASGTRLVAAASLLCVGDGSGIDLYDCRTFALRHSRPALGCPVAWRRAEEERLSWLEREGPAGPFHLLTASSPEAELAREGLEGLGAEETEESEWPDGRELARVRLVGVGQRLLGVQLSRPDPLPSALLLFEKSKRGVWQPVFELQSQELGGTPLGMPQSLLDKGFPVSGWQEQILLIWAKKTTADLNEIRVLSLGVSLHKSLTQADPTNCQNTVVTTDL